MGRGKSQRSLDLIRASQAILEEIQPATVRAVCYRLFTLRLISSMKKSETNRVGTQLVYARERGIIPWPWIVDETRAAEYGGGWENPEAFAEAAKRSYRRNRWATQPRRVEVWSEKGTVRGTLGPVLQEYGVIFRVMHGYASATTVYEVAAENRNASRPLLALYVGDWDPSGLHMSELDLPGRLGAYTAGVSPHRLPLDGDDDLFGGLLTDLAAHFGNGNISLRRIALTEQQIVEHRLPPFLADTKRGDTRWRWYVDRYGSRCWELDALSPVVLRERVARAILREIDREAWNRAGRGEAAEQKTLAAVLGKWGRSISGQAKK